MFGNRNLQILGAENRRARSVGATLRRLLRYFRPYLWALLLVAVFVVGGTYMQVLIPDLTGQAVDCYLGPISAGGQEAAAQPAAPPGLELDSEVGGAFGNCWYTTPNPEAGAAEVIRGLGLLILLIAGLFIGSAVVSGLQFFLMSWAGFHLLRDLRNRVFEHVHRLSMGYFHPPPGRRRDEPLHQRRRYPAADHRLRPGERHPGGAADRLGGLHDARQELGVCPYQPPDAAADDGS